MTRIILTALTIVYVQHQIVGQQIITDRPDQTESAITMDKNRLQIETGTLFSNDEQIESWVVNSTLFRYGVSDKFELRLVTELERAEVSESRMTGMRDLQLGLKYQLIERDIQLAYMFHLIIPSGNEFLTADQTGFSNKILFSHDVSERMSFGYNFGIDYFDEDRYGFVYTWAAGYTINDRTGFYAELYGDWDQFDEFYVNFDGGFTYLLEDHVQADFSVGSGITDRSTYIALGLSWLIPN